MKNRRERRISVRRPTVPVDQRWSYSSSHHDSQLLFARTPIPPWFLIHADQSSQSSTIFCPSSILSTRWSNSGSMGASHTDSVKTSLQVYLEIQTRKFLVDYERIPATDEKSPKEHDFDMLVDRISRADLKTEIIFNCQMGHGRITTGMVIATLIYLNQIGASGLGRPVFWHNMREEPVIYINGKPFLLREVERPYKNMLEYTGIYCERVERMEARLKEDILKELNVMDVRTVRFIAFMKDWKSNDLVVSMSLGHLCMSPEELIISFVAEQEGKEILDQHASWSE
ncbi:unnamed protein product [Lactuca saligna]|uniref:Tyrosine specific protein phosphatases domain-containing protein n=1 Tax=Lactuca saligna TaxID=75948 RepID=A0AA36E5Q7_LACSI|nr:unnamed protein product [Lactuca saligna]